MTAAEFLEVEHARSGERHACEFVQILATLERRRARARVLVLRWPTAPAGGVLFDLASGWCLEARSWRLTDDARARARALAEGEGLELPRLRRSRPLPSSANNAAKLLRAAQAFEPVDPRQIRLPHT